MAFTLVELAEKFLPVLACELPIERLRRRFVVVLKIQQVLGEDFQVRESFGVRTFLGTIEK